MFSDREIRLIRHWLLVCIRVLGFVFVLGLSGALALNANLVLGWRVFWLVVYVATLVVAALTPVVKKP